MSIKIVLDMNVSPDLVEVFQSEGWVTVHWSQVGSGNETNRVLHPSYILRLQGMAPLEYEQAIKNFRADVRKAVEQAGLVE